MFPELILIIAQIWTIHASKFHPVFALVSSLFGLLLWVSAATTNGITTYSDELSFDEQDAWERLCYAETGFQVLIAVLYFPMLVGSCMAVHRWRRMKREEEKEGYKMGKVNSQENV